jgi:outer membrane receptor protein involved in Fe transport
MKLHLRSATALAALTVSSQLAAFADPDAAETDRRLETVTVTTQKQEQTLIDVPINVSVTDQSMIDKLATDDLEDLGNFIPGLQVQAQSLNAPSYSLRGVVSDSGTPRVALFQNGVAIGNPGFASNLAIYDMERVEVVKGPQATLFGQGALVGGINFIQNRASLEGNSGSVLLEGGDYNSVRAEGHYNWAVSDTLALRVAGQIKNMDGYVPNTANSPDLMGQDTTALRTALHWAPTDKLTADVFVNYQKDDSTGTQFTSGYFPVNGKVDPYGATAMNINPDQVRSKLGNDRDLFYITSNIQYDLNDAWSLTSLTDYRNLISKEAWDSDGAAFNLLQFYQAQKAKTFSQELRLNYDAGGKLTAFFGGNYFTIDKKADLRFSTDEAYAQSLFAPTLAGAAGLTVAQAQGYLALLGVPDAANFGSFDTPMQYSALAALLLNQTVPLYGEHAEQQLSTEGRDTYDLFGDVTYAVNDKLKLTAGLRYTKEDLSASTIGYALKTNPYLKALGGLNGVTLSPTLLLSADTLNQLASDSESTDGAFTWRLNASYRVSDNVNTWVAYGRGRRPEVLSASGATYDLIDAETLDNIETGVFGRFFDDRLQMTSSIYYGQYKDFQTTRFDPINGVFITENSGNATQYGFEFDGQALVNDYVRLLATYAFTHSEYDNKDDNGNPLQFAGNKFRLSPEHSFSLAADITVPVGEHGDISIVPSYIWKSKHFFEDDNGFDYAADGNGGFIRTPEMYPDGTVVQEYQKAYGVANLRVAYDAASGGWGAYVLGENIFDEEYLIDVGNTGGAFGLHTIIRGKPQMVKAGVYFKF